MSVPDTVDRAFDTYDETWPVSKLRGAFETSNRKVRSFVPCRRSARTKTFAKPHPS